MSLQTQLASFAAAVGGDVKSLNLRVGSQSLANLTTSAKASLVDAINEVNAKPTSTGGAVINDLATNSTNAWSSTKIVTEIGNARAALKTELLGGATAAYDTLQELKAILDADDTADQASLATLTTAVGNKVAYNASQTLTTAQQDQARANINAASASGVGNTEQDLVAAYTTAKA